MQELSDPISVAEPAFAPSLILEHLEYKIAKS
jgi:hypothetical protein